MSSVSVATNALRLRGFKWPDSALQVVETTEAAMELRAGRSDWRPRLFSWQHASRIGREQWPPLGDIYLPPPAGRGPGRVLAEPFALAVQLRIVPIRTDSSGFGWRPWRKREMHDRTMAGAG